MLGRLNVKVHVDTISGWLGHYVELAEKYAGPMQPPNLGSRLDAGEKRQGAKARKTTLSWQWILPPASYRRGRPLQAR